MNKLPPDRQITLGVVSYLNARPLIAGLEHEPGVTLRYAVPAALADMLRNGEVDAALVPVIDLVRESPSAGEGGRWERISDAGIGCDGRTMTVRVFSRVPPEKIAVLHADVDSHTSVALARIIWRHRYRRPVHVEPLTGTAHIADCAAVLLIGDKVVSAPTQGFAYDLDLGAAWQEWTALPFVFAVWAAPRGRVDNGLAAMLNKARDLGVARAAVLAAELGPAHGWPVELAVEYLTTRMKYKLTPPALQGLRRFLALAAEENVFTDREELLR